MVVEAPLSSYPQTYGDDAPSGFPGNVNPEQQAALDKLRKELEEAGYTLRLDEASLLRFLRARRFDVEKTKEMFIACEKWRKDFGTDTIIQDFHYIEKVEVSKYYPQYYHKTDKDGRPVYVEQLGGVDLKQMYKITTMDRMIKNLVWEYETFTKYRLPACSRKAGKLVETSCTIMDLKGVGISQVSQVYHYVREASTIGQNYYPERMGKFYLINAPFGFSTAFRLIRPLLDPVTVEKIFILSSSYKADLLKQVGPENLPKKFGGACQCPDGCELSDAGPWHDQEFIGPEGEAMSAAEYAKKYTEEHPEEAKAEMMATAAAAMNHAR